MNKEIDKILENYYKEYGFDSCVFDPTKYGQWEQIKKNKAYTEKELKEALHNVKRLISQIKTYSDILELKDVESGNADPVEDGR